MIRFLLALVLLSACTRTASAPDPRPSMPLQLRWEGNTLREAAELAVTAWNEAMGCEVFAWGDRYPVTVWHGPLPGWSHSTAGIGAAWSHVTVRSDTVFPERVFAHELGHLLGLDHSPAADSVMLSWPMTYRPNAADRDAARASLRERGLL